MYVRHCNHLVEVLAPAKINLFLEVLSRRGDGFHEIETLMVPIDLFDTVVLAPRPERRILIECDWAEGARAQSAADPVHGSEQWPEIPQGDANLVARVLCELQQRAGIKQGATVRVVKRIPVAAGLGGASSDAAAALLAANHVWRLDWPTGRLAELAGEFGSDIPFFIHQTASLCRGRGEVVEAVHGLRRLNLVILRPPQGLATADVYRHCRPAAQRRSSQAVLDAVRGGRAELVGRLLFNRLQEAAGQVAPWIAQLAKRFERLGCCGHQMSGSGSSCFGICRHARHARYVSGRLRAAGWGAAFPATTLKVAVRQG